VAGHRKRGELRPGALSGDIKKQPRKTLKKLGELIYKPLGERRRGNNRRRGRRKD